MATACVEGRAAAVPSQSLTPSRVLASTADVAKASRPPLHWVCRCAMSSTWARAEALSSRSSRSCLFRSSAHALSYRPDGEVWVLRKHSAVLSELRLCLMEEGLSCKPGGTPWLQYAHSIAWSFSASSGPCLSAGGLFQHICMLLQASTSAEPAGNSPACQGAAAPAGAR